MRGTRTTGAALAAGLLVLAGCSHAPAPGPGATASSLPDDVALAVHQYRSDEVNQVLAVQIANDSAAPVEVASLDVRAPGFRGPGVVRFSATIGAGRTYDLRVPLGVAQCDGPAPSGELVVGVGLAGRDAVVEVIPQAGAELTRRLHADLCAVEAALAALPMRWGARWVPVADKIRGTLLVGPAGTERPVSVTGIAATTLVDPLDHDLPRSVARGESARIPVSFAPTRCDAHAFADSKKGFEVPLWITLAGGQQTSLTVTPSVGAQQRILDHLLAVCDLQ